MQSTLNESSSAVWEQLAPLLDEAMASLGETDRNALALRYFENKTAREIGRALEDERRTPRKKRVNRALEKLRKFFTKRGVDSDGGDHCRNDFRQFRSSRAGGAGKNRDRRGDCQRRGGSASTLTLIKGALKIMAWTKMKTAAVAGAVVILATEQQ